MLLPGGKENFDAKLQPCSEKDFGLLPLNCPKKFRLHRGRQQDRVNVAKKLVIMTIGKKKKIDVKISEIFDKKTKSFLVKTLFKNYNSPPHQLCENSPRHWPIVASLSVVVVSWWGRRLDTRASLLFMPGKTTHTHARTQTSQAL